MKIVFLADPYENFDLEHDTTYLLMCCAQRRGHKLFHLTQGDIFFKKNQVFVQVTSLTLENDQLISNEKCIYSCDEIDIIFLNIVFFFGFT